MWLSCEDAVFTVGLVKSFFFSMSLIENRKKAGYESDAAFMWTQADGHHRQNKQTVQHDGRMTKHYICDDMLLWR